MEPGEIEFVGSGEPAPPPAPREPPSASRLVRVGLAVVVVAAGIAWAVTRSSGSGHNPVAVASPSSPKLVHPVPTSSAPAPADYRTTPIGMAVAKYLPLATVTSISYVYVADPASGGTTVTQLLVEAHQDSVEVLLRVRPYRHPEPQPTTGITPTPPGLGSAFFQFETAASVVDVEWIGTDSTPPPVDALSSLADDPRLATLG